MSRLSEWENMQKTESLVGPHPKRSMLLGEWSWEKYVLLVAGIGCLMDAIVASLVAGGASGSLDILHAGRALIRDDAFHAALLFAVLFHQSELRYKLFPEVRNDRTL